MSQEIEDLKKLGQYFNKRIDESSNSLYVNGYSAEKNKTTVNKIYDEVFLEANNIMNVLPEEQVLEIGTGSGELLYRLNNITGNASGVDISEGMAKLTRQKNLNVTLYDGWVLPFDKDTFDCLILYQVFINIPNDVARNLIKEAVRVVKKNGRIFIGAVPHPERSALPTHAGNWRTLLKKVLGIKQPIPYTSYDYSFFTKEFDKLGLSQVSFFPCTVQLPNWDTKFHILLNT
jgi:ubiquinone/menaquinone biosynthesis C-methylase UbiE